MRKRTKLESELNNKITNLLSEYNNECERIITDKYEQQDIKMPVLSCLDRTKLKPELQRKINKFLAKCEKKGYEVGIGECVRTDFEQDILYNRGRITPGDIWTNDKGSTYESQHQWFIAFDIFRLDGKGGGYYDKDDWFYKVAKIAKSCGLGWGGDCRFVNDKKHFYLKRWGSTTDTLKKRYGTPENFRKKWIIKK